MALTTAIVQEHMKKGAVVINVLDKPIYEDLHIKGSINIPLGKKSDDEFVAAVEKKVGPGKFIITHCSGVTCMAGPRAAQILKAHKFNAEDYPGGMEEWSAGKLPMEGKKAIAYAS
ncbi:MAG TPA: rhodanese-like domain-containing protein [bacterium]|nr:rhodanese-like domain-containing protein [bacterium]